MGQFSRSSGLHILVPATVVTISLHSHRAAAFSTYNATTDKDQVVCVYQLSGQYGLLQRILTYSLFVFVTLARESVWLVAGALAWIMTFSGTAAVHALLLAISSRGLYDLDVVGIWTVLNISCFAVPLMLRFSRANTHLPTRPIFRIWGAFILVGIMLTLVSLLRDYPTEHECRSSTGVLLRDIGGVRDPTFNCTYTCFDHKQLLRSSKDVAVISKKRAFGEPYFTLKAWSVGFTVYFIALNIFTWLRRGRGRPDTPLPLSHCGSIVLLFFFSVLVVANEIYFLWDHPLPFNEQPYQVDQWGSWVAVTLSLVAAVYVKLERRKMLDQEQAARELAQRSSSSAGLAQDQNDAERGRRQTSSEEHSDNNYHNDTMFSQSSANVTISTKDQSTQTVIAKDF